MLQLVGEEEGPQIGGGTSTRRKQADRRTAYAASLRKGEPVAEVEDEAIVENTEAPAEDEASVEEAAATDAPETEDIAEAAADSDEAAVEADDEDDKKSDG